MANVGSYTNLNRCRKTAELGHKLNYGFIDSKVRVLVDKSTTIDRAIAVAAEDAQVVDVVVSRVFVYVVERQVEVSAALGASKV